MKKTRKYGSSPRAKRAAKSVKHTRDSQIDFSDIPELTDKQLSEMKRVGRPPLGASTKQLIAIRLEPALLDRLRRLSEKEGRGYQTLIHDILESYVKRRPA